MKTVLKSLIVWVLLLAVPFQGFASATMLMCAPMQPILPAAALAKTAVAPHDHHAMSTQGSYDRDHHSTHAAAAAGHVDSTDHQSAGHHANGKCNACASCCFGAAMPPSPVTRVPAETQHFAVVPFDSGFVPAVDLALPERPPQSSLT